MMAASAAFKNDMCRPTHIATCCVLLNSTTAVIGRTWIEANSSHVPGRDT